MEITEEQETQVKEMVAIFVKGLMEGEEIQKFIALKDNGHIKPSKEKSEKMAPVVEGAMADWGPETKIRTCVEQLRDALTEAGKEKLAGSTPSEGDQEIVTTNLKAYYDEKGWSTLNDIEDMVVFVRAIVMLFICMVAKTRLCTGQLPEEAYAGWEEKSVSFEDMEKDLAN